MDDKPPSGEPVAEGQEFWKCVWESQDKCEALTDEQLPGFGKRAPDVFIKLGTVASMLDRIASCWWGCSGGDHAAEYLVGRATTLLHGAVRLMRFGLYDEALNLVRSLGELANLMLLFAQDSEAVFDEWKRGDLAQRRDGFKPVRIRRRLKELGGVLPMDDAHYAKLCESVTHPTPGVRPQDYNPEDRAILAAILQPAGVIVVLNEAGMLSAMITIGATKLISVPREAKLAVLRAGKALALATGTVFATDLPSAWHKKPRHKPE